MRDVIKKNHHRRWSWVIRIEKNEILHVKLVFSFIDRCVQKFKRGLFPFFHQTSIVIRVYSAIFNTTTKATCGIGKKIKNLNMLLQDGFSNFQSDKFSAFFAILISTWCKFHTESYFKIYYQKKVFYLVSSLVIETGVISILVSFKFNWQLYSGWWRQNCAKHCTWFKPSCLQIRSVQFRCDFTSRICFDTPCIEDSMHKLAK